MTTDPALANGITITYANAFAANGILYVLLAGKTTLRSVGYSATICRVTFSPEWWFKLGAIEIAEEQNTLYRIIDKRNPVLTQISSGLQQFKETINNNNYIFCFTSATATSGNSFSVRMRNSPLDGTAGETYGWRYELALPLRENQVYKNLSNTLTYSTTDETIASTITAILSDESRVTLTPTAEAQSLSNVAAFYIETDGTVSIEGTVSDCKNITFDPYLMYSDCVVTIS